MAASDCRSLASPSSAYREAVESNPACDHAIVAIVSEPVVGGVHAGVIQVTDVHAAGEEMRGRGAGVRGVRHRGDAERESRGQRTIARTPDGGEGRRFKDSEGNPVGVASALGGQGSGGNRGSATYRLSTTSAH